MAQEVRPVLEVGTALEGERACDTLREHGIKCACVETASEEGRNYPLGYLRAGAGDMTFTVIVAPEDAERAHQILEDCTDVP